MKYKVLKPTGILDGQNANQLRHEISTTIDSGIQTIVLNLELVSFMNSSAIGALVATLKSVRSTGGDMLLCSLNSQLKMIFELTRMDQIFKIYSDYNEIESKPTSMVLIH